uniref:Uncharacterized protein n=1 Tax=Ditylenchus dipsaci TaxID=166011 RepID=A0A915CXK0_9BILA
MPPSFCTSCSLCCIGFHHVQLLSDDLHCCLTPRSDHIRIAEYKKNLAKIQGTEKNPKKEFCRNVVGLSFLLMGVSGELAFYETWDRTEPSDNPFDDVPPFPFSFDYEGNTIISGLNFVDAIIDLSQPPYYNHNLGSQFIEYQLFVKSGGSCEKGIRWSYRYLPILYPVPMRSQWINNRLVKNEEFGPYVQKQPFLMAIYQQKQVLVVRH